MKKSTFLSNFHFFGHKINIFAPKLILTETLVILPQSARHYFITEENDILKQNNIFPTNETL